MDIGEWSHESGAFKTITSESETRNQTTNKKQNSKARSKQKQKPVHRYKSNSVHTNSKLGGLKNHSLEGLQQILQAYKTKRYNLVAAQKYRRLGKTNQLIQQIQLQIQNRKNKLLDQQKQQYQFQIYQTHQEEMKAFKHLWKQIFRKLEVKQKILKQRLQQQHAEQVQQRVNYLQKKEQQIIKKEKYDKQLQDLRRLEESLIKSNKWESLVKLDIAKKKKQIKNRLKSERLQQLRRLQQLQQEKLKKKYNTKVNSFNIKMEQCRDYQFKIYKANQQKLKRKFLNTLNKLEHEAITKKRCMSAIK